MILIDFEQWINKPTGLCCQSSFFWPPSFRWECGSFCVCVRMSMCVCVLCGKVSLCVFDWGWHGTEHKKYVDFEWISSLHSQSNVNVENGQKRKYARPHRFIHINFFCMCHSRSQWMGAVSSGFKANIITLRKRDNYVHFGLLFSLSTIRFRRVHRPNGEWKTIHSFKTFTGMNDESRHSPTGRQNCE